MPRLSVIIPVYNDEKAFEKCLTSVFQSDFKDFEVVVVNDASTDNSLAVAKKFPCRIIDLKTNAGVANARNQGANAAKADILVFFDSDVVIEKDTLSKFAKNHENSNIKVCQCQIRPKSLSKGFAPDLTAILWRYVFKRMGSNPSYVSTMAFSIDKKVFNEIGQFNTFFESAGGEEFEIGTALKNQNYKIFFDQSFSIYHHFQYFWPRFKTLFRRSYLYGRIFLDRKFEFDKGHGTFKEGINSLLSLAGIFSLFLIPFSPLFLLIFPSTILLQLFLDLNQNSYIAKKRGFLFFLLSIPLNYAWYFSMSLGVSKAVLFHYSKKFFSPFRNFSFLFSNTPPYVIFFVTANCNARCKHCFYWKKIQNFDPNKELSLDEIKKISSNFGRIKYLTFSGGEPTLRKDIVEITQAFYKNNNIEILNFITNGFATNLLVDQTKKILRTCPNLSLMISFSIDGINKQHDKIRNFPNGFNKLIKSIEEIKKLRKHHKNLKTFVITTYSKYNKDNILEITDYITNKLGLEMELNYVRGDTKNKEAKDITLANYIRAKRMIMKFNEKNAKKGFKERMLRSINNLCFNLVVKTERENKRIIPCFVGKKMIDIAEDGTIFPCEMMDINFGNIKDFDYDIKKILKSDRARNFFKFLKQKKCYCTWECAMKNNILYSPRHYPSLLKEWLKTFF